MGLGTRLVLYYHFTYFSYYAYIITAVAVVGLQQRPSMELKRKQRAFFKYGPLPKEGITLSLETETGHVNLYATDRIKNPNSAFNDYQIEDNGSVFISSEGLHGGRNESKTLYVTAEGIGNGSNAFQIRTGNGDTRPGISK